MRKAQAVADWREQNLGRPENLTAANWRRYLAQLISFGHLPKGTKWVPPAGVK